MADHVSLFHCFNSGRRSVMTTMGRIRALFGLDASELARMRWNVFVTLQQPTERTADRHLAVLSSVHRRYQDDD